LPSSDDATFDFLIVGGGSAGGWIARRLAAHRIGRVALIEAGSSSNDPRTRVPNWYARTFGTPLDWNFSTETQSELSNRRIAWPRGRLLGGSGAINALIYLQAASADFERWGWDWAPQWLDSQLHHNQLTEDKLLPHAPPASPHPWSEAFVEAAAEFGLQITAPWSQSQPNTCGLYSIAQRQGRRAHSAEQLDVLAELQVFTNCHAERIELQRGRAVGLDVAFAGEGSQRLSATRGIVLCAGVIGTPQLLWQSGIGCAQALHDVHIDCQVDLPAVGSNLQDHLVYPLVFSTHTPDGLRRRSTPVDRRLYRASGQGVLASNIAEAGALLSLNRDCTASTPELQIHFTPTHYLRYPKLASTDNHLTLAVTDLHPRSRGSLTPRLAAASRGNGARVDVAIDPHYLEHPDDLERLLAGVEAARAIAGQPSLNRIISAEQLPGPKRQDKRSLQRSIQTLAQSIYHPVGTCRMQVPQGNEGSRAETPAEASVVDGEFRVHGVEGLRIADASVLPDLPSGNSNAVTLLLAARLCQLIEAGS
jgi:choline dehydrogenase